MSTLYVEGVLLLIGDLQLYIAESCLLRLS